MEYFANTSLIKTRSLWDRKWILNTEHNDFTHFGWALDKKTKDLS